MRTQPSDAGFSLMELLAATAIGLVVIGTAIGAVVGVASGELGFWMPTGAALGVAVGFALGVANGKQNKTRGAGAVLFEHERL